MKNFTNINVTFLVTISLVIGASFYVWKYINPGDTFKLNDSYNVAILPDDNLEVNDGSKSSVSFTSEVDKQLKVCVYEAGNGVQAKQIACWALSKGKTIEWEDAPSLFLLKVFNPAALDEPLVTESDVEHMSKIIISKK